MEPSEISDIKTLMAKMEEIFNVKYKESKGHGTRNIMRWSYGVFAILVFVFWFIENQETWSEDPFMLLMGVVVMFSFFASGIDTDLLKNQILLTKLITLVHGSVNVFVRVLISTQEQQNKRLEEMTKGGTDNDTSDTGRDRPDSGSQGNAPSS